MKKVPEHFNKYPGEDIMSNFDHQVIKETEQAIKEQPLYSFYSGWNFHGTVWHEGSKWYCQVYCYGSHINTIEADSPEEIMNEACDLYGRA